MCVCIIISIVCIYPCLETSSARVRANLGFTKGHQEITGTHFVVGARSIISHRDGAYLSRNPLFNSFLFAASGSNTSGLGAWIWDYSRYRFAFPPVVPQTATAPPAVHSALVGMCLGPPQPVNCGIDPKRFSGAFLNKDLAQVLVLFTIVFFLPCDKPESLHEAGAPSPGVSLASWCRAMIPSSCSCSRAARAG